MASSFPVEGAEYPGLSQIGPQLSLPGCVASAHLTETVWTVLNLSPSGWTRFALAVLGYPLQTLLLLRWSTVQSETLLLQMQLTKVLFLFQVNILFLHLHLFGIKEICGNC